VKNSLERGYGLPGMWGNYSAKGPGNMQPKKKKGGPPKTAPAPRNGVSKLKARGAPKKKSGVREGRGPPNCSKEGGVMCCVIGRCLSILTGGKDYKKKAAKAEDGAVWLTE